MLTKKLLVAASIIAGTHATVAAQNLTRWVDPFLGTGGHGHTYPGATRPFGMVQLSPDNGTEGWDWSSGYHYSSDSIAGFSHTHLNGTGIGDWCDISFQPLADTVNSGERFIKHAFQHKNEKAAPGYYSVQFNNGIKRVIGHHVWSSELIPNLGVKQIPLIYAWAITIHKSQGLSLDIAQIDAGSSIFECGQTYVALSRVKSLEGLYLTDLNLKKIKVNKKVKQYYEEL